MALYSQILKWLFDNLSNPLFAAIFAGVIVYTMMYLEARISKTEIHKRTYTKNILLVGTIVGGIVFVLTNYTLNPKLNKIVEEGSKIIEGAVNGTSNLANEINYDASDIFLGEPKF